MYFECINSSLVTEWTGLLISNIDIDTIDDTFEILISVSTILSYKSIDRGIDDTFWPFLATLISILLSSHAK